MTFERELVRACRSPQFVVRAIFAALVATAIAFELLSL